MLENVFGTEVSNTESVKDITNFVMKTSFTNGHVLSGMSIGRRVCTLNIASPFGVKELFQFPDALVQSDDFLLLDSKEIGNAKTLFYEMGVVSSCCMNLHLVLPLLFYGGCMGN